MKKDEVACQFRQTSINKEYGEFYPLVNKQHQTSFVTLLLKIRMQNTLS
jgi:hypothetical protein